MNVKAESGSSFVIIECLQRQCSQRHAVLRQREDNSSATETLRCCPDRGRCTNSPKAATLHSPEISMECRLRCIRHWAANRSQPRPEFCRSPLIRELELAVAKSETQSVRLFQGEGRIQYLRSKYFQIHRLPDYRQCCYRVSLDIVLRDTIPKTHQRTLL